MLQEQSARRTRSSDDQLNKYLGTAYGSKRGRDDNCAGGMVKCASAKTMPTSERKYVALYGQKFASSCLRLLLTRHPIYKSKLQQPAVQYRPACVYPAPQTKAFLFSSGWTEPFCRYRISGRLNQGAFFPSGTPGKRRLSRWEKPFSSNPSQCS